VILAEKAVPVRAAAGLRAGDVLRFERRADGPLDLRVAGRPMAQGVVVRVGDRFGLRITSLLGPGDRPSGE
jgi:flagellar motor switch/type III secretory pathway protein FliN